MMRNSYMPYSQPSYNFAQPSHPMSYSQQLSPGSYYAQQPIGYQQQSRIEQIPYEKKTIDYYPQEKVEYIPQEQKYQDFLEVQHELDYVPVPRLEKYTDQVPIERFDTYYDYVPRQNTIVRSTGSNYIPPPNQYQYGPRQYSPQAYSPSTYGPSSFYNRPMNAQSYGPTSFYNRPMNTQMGSFGYPGYGFNQGRMPAYYPGGRYRYS